MERPFEPFALEAYFEGREFSLPHQAGVSDVEPLGLGELLAMASEEERDAFERSSLGYSEVGGSLPLRTAIAATYDGSIGPDDVVVCTGGQEAIAAVTDVLGGPGRRAVVVTPTYQSLHEGLRRGHADVALLPLDDRGREGFALDHETLARALAGASLLVVNAPSNPTGWSPSPGEWSRIVELAGRAGARVVADEAYRGTERRGAIRPAACESAADAVSIGVVSKLHGLAGLRIGWVASRDRELLHQVRLRKHWASICSASPSESLAAIALRRQDRLRARALTLLERGTAAAVEAFAGSRDVLPWRAPEAGTTAFLRFPGESGDELADRAAADGILVLPGSVFGPEWSSYVRIGFGRAGSPEALGRLARLTAPVRAP